MEARILPPKSIPPSLQVDTLKLLSRLLQMPQVEPWIRNAAHYLLPPRPFHATFIMPGSLLAQPVELLHATFCLGAPLCTLLDMLGLPSPPSLILDHDPNIFPYFTMNMAERELYLQSFIQRVSLLENTGKIRYGEVIRSSDLWFGGSVGWSKIVKMVSRVLDGLQEMYPGVYVQPQDAATKKHALFSSFEESERRHIQGIKTLRDEVVALGLEANPVLESVLVNLERIVLWHEHILSAWKSSITLDELLNWENIFGSAVIDQTRIQALGAYRSLCAGFFGLTDYLTSPKLALSGHHSGSDILHQIALLLKQVPHYVHMLDQLTIFLCPPLSHFDDGSHGRPRKPSSAGSSISNSSLLTSLSSLKSSSAPKPSLYQFSSRPSSLMTVRRTASTNSSSQSNRRGTIMNGPLTSSPQTTLGRSASYETSRSPEDLAIRSWISLHTQLHSLSELSVTMAEVGSTVKGMWGGIVVQDLLSLDPITMDKWGSFIMDDKLIVSLRRMGVDEWDEVEVDLYAFEKTIIVCRSAKPTSHTEDVYPIMPWSPGPVIMEPRRDSGEGSIICMIPLEFDGPREVYVNFFSEEQGERFVVFWPGHALEFICLYGTPGAGHSQWEMWCSIFQGLKGIAVNVQITVPSPPSPEEKEDIDISESDEEEDDEYAKYIDVSVDNSRVNSRATTPASQLDTDQAYDDASLRIPSPSTQLTAFSKPKPWSLIGRKSSRSETSSLNQDEDLDSETHDSTGSFVVDDGEGSEYDEDEDEDVATTAFASIGKKHHRKRSSHTRDLPHDSGVGIEQALAHWSAIPEDAPEDDPLTPAAYFPDLKDLTGQIELEGRYPVASGGYGDVWKASLNPFESSESETPTTATVAVKVLRARANDPVTQAKIQRRLNRELSIWKRLSHSHVLPLLGVAHDAFGSHGYAMVCPWLENGSVGRWLEKCGDVMGAPERLALICEVADGLSYLHSQDIVHGDLCGSNILIDDDGHAVLCDFGLSALVNQLELPSTTPNSVLGVGNIRWADPTFYQATFGQDDSENPDPSSSPSLPKVTTKSDIYSFGSVMLEILSGRIPYHYINNEGKVLLEISQGKKPRRPASTFVDDGQWEVIQKCWIQDAAERPDIQEVVTLVADLGLSFQAG